MPRVSVLMTVYNGIPFLEESLKSVLNQTYLDFECVVVDDGSTDGTADLLRQFSERDPRFFIIHRENGGTAAAANQGLAQCSGEYVARMDADDISLPTRLERQVAYLDAHPDCGLVGTQVVPLGDRGIGKSLHLPLDHSSISIALRSGRHAVAHSAIMMRTTLLKQIDGYWKHRLVDDWDMMLRMSEICQLANMNEVLHHYRIHRGSLNGKQMARMRLSIDYAVELARCRREGRKPTDLQAFVKQREARPVLVRVAEKIDIFARSNYRLATAEILGGAKTIGYLRMVLAAFCQPKLTIERITRVVRARMK